MLIFQTNLHFLKKLFPCCSLSCLPNSVLLHSLFNHLKSTPKIMATKRTDLQLFDQLITTHALPTYSQMKYGRIAYLFAHIHALQELDIITENYMHYNFSEFCRHLQQITHDKHFSRSKAHIRHQYPTSKQILLTEEIIKEYKLVL